MVSSREKILLADKKAYQEDLKKQLDQTKQSLADLEEKKQSVTTKMRRLKKD